MTKELTGMVFDIERYATEDGPGIRTVIFLKGCSLHCLWCANPESQEAQAQIMYYSNQCKGCGRCITLCPQNAIRESKEFGLIIDQRLCNVCGKCVEQCYYDARKKMGNELSVSQVMKEIEKDLLFYEKSGGGVTLSGGEPLEQIGFIEAILKECRTIGIHTALETCGFAPWESIEKVLPLLDLIYYDIKHMDSKKHIKLTGVANEKILANLKKLDDKFKSIIVRVPFIPDCNSDIKNMGEIFQFVKQLKNVLKIEILPYHRLGISKYHGLGRKYKLYSVEPALLKDMEYLIALGKACDLKVQIGAGKQ
jgi:pyruvate formate lyase activating enzyme